MRYTQSFLLARGIIIIYLLAEFLVVYSLRAYGRGLEVTGSSWKQRPLGLIHCKFLGNVGIAHKASNRIDPRGVSGWKLKINHIWLIQRKKNFPELLQHTLSGTLNYPKEPSEKKNKWINRNGPPLAYSDASKKNSLKIVPKIAPTWANPQRWVLESWLQENSWPNSCLYSPAT